MAQHTWINPIFLTCVLGAFVALTGCSSSINKVVPDTKLTMKEIYESKTGHGNAEAIQRRDVEIRARPIASDEDYVSELPPRAAQIQHLFPALPNPELFMYVKPHVVGTSGAAVPAYMTRFTMYERAHYAMPNEVISRPNHPLLKCVPEQKQNGECKRVEEIDARTLNNNATGKKGKRS